MRGRSGGLCAFVERAIVSGFVLVACVSVRPGLAEARNERVESHSAEHAVQGRIPDRIHLVSRTQRIHQGSHLPTADLRLALHRSPEAHLAVHRSRPQGGGTLPPRQVAESTKKMNAKRSRQQDHLLSNVHDLPVYLDAVLQSRWPANESHSRSAPTLRRMFPVELEVNGRFRPGKVTQLPRALFVKMGAKSGYPGALVGHLWRDGRRTWHEGRQTWTLTLEPRLFEILKGELDYLDGQLRTQLQAEYAQHNGVFVPIDKLPSVASDRQDFISTHKRNVSLRGTAAFERRDGSLHRLSQRRTTTDEQPSSAGSLAARN